MATFFLIMIYLSFISLGLPDSLLGAAWPVMQEEYGAAFGVAGVINIVIASGTIVSSLMSGALLKRLGTGQITLISCLMTAAALLGFSFAPSIIWLMVLALPLGLGAGSVDAALNHYVATHYQAHHMSWLHCFWGVGATLGPIIMSGFMRDHDLWRNGYLTISLIQFALVVLLAITLPLWKRMENIQRHAVKESQVQPSHGQVEQPLRTKGVKLTLLTFLFYCGAEASVGLWGSSFLVNAKELPAAVAAVWVAMYYGGITVGRFITGFVTFKVSNRVLIRSGLLVSLAGAALLMLPLPTFCSLIGFLLLGLGFAPIYPCMLHDTPERFGKEQTQKLMGYQMAVAYTGATLLPPLLGWLAAQTTVSILPFFTAFYIVFMLYGSERVNRIMKQRTAQSEMI
ncbi:MULTISPECIES: sugar MFS transporter [Brevibacillus]|uniref:MFS transporter n=1 Tax=Brevibacillus brevis TaxID=1393 RepID=A0A2Z4MHZ0_BREBE|nr:MULTISPECIES: MFS transporter [Brevibacillus]AWX56125.1 MFS transporter [Brevibacillus brevis]NRR20366.1 MFS transporter [Brevibacillus sp. MS2.2]